MTHEINRGSTGSHPIAVANRKAEEEEANSIRNAKAKAEKAVYDKAEKAVSKPKAKPKPSIKAKTKATRGSY